MRRLGLAIFVVVLASACSSPAPVTTLHDLHQPATLPSPPTLTQDFYALPFPNNLRIEADGTIDLSAYPRREGLLTQYVDAVDEDMRGFGTNGGIYFRFDGAVDPTTLPADSNATLSADASAFVVDVTPSSPTFGQKRPVIVHYVDAQYDYIGPHWVCLLPFPGVPLREKTTYAAILTSGIKGVDGKVVQRAPDFTAAMGRASSDPKIAAEQVVLAPLTTWQATQPGLADRIINATVFTTVDATSMMTTLRKAVYDQAPEPTLENLKYTDFDKLKIAHTYEGTFQGPNFQEGTPPYSDTGGELVFNAQGIPQMQRLESSLRVAMSIPDDVMPDDGWPVVIYAHGTGGDYRSFLGDGSGSGVALITNSDGSPITRMAMISMDQVLHGPRAPMTDADLAFFNLNNIRAARTNVKQGALDDFQLLRLIKNINVGAAPTTGAPIRFNPKKIYFKGHSQGGLTGPLFLAAEPEVQAAILSGAGGGIILALLNKTKPVNIPMLVSAILADPIDQFHPLLSLVQLYFEDSDPINYARLLFQEPASGMAKKPIFQSLGLIDNYAPVPVIKALGMAIGVQPITPILDPIDGLDFVNLQWGSPPTQDNVGGSAVTGVLLEYNQKKGSDGHFVIFDIPAAAHQSNRFLGTHSVTGTALLTPP